MRLMKKHFLRLLCFCALLLGPVSCKKFIEQQKTNAMEDIITKRKTGQVDQ